MIVRRLELRRRHIADRLQESTVIEPVDPFQRCVFHGFQMPPGTATVNHFGLVESDNRFRRAAGALTASRSADGSRAATAPTVGSCAQDETALTAPRFADSETVASAPPVNDEERCCASNTSAGSARNAQAISNCLSSSRASRLTLGQAAERTCRHAAVSNIHCGIATARAWRLGSRAQCATAPPAITRMS